jgi:hypothetical protein
MRNCHPPTPGYSSVAPFGGFPFFSDFYLGLTPQAKHMSPLRGFRRPPAHPGEGKPRPYDGKENCASVGGHEDGMPSVPPGSGAG